MFGWKVVVVEGTHELRHPRRSEHVYISLATSQQSVKVHGETYLALPSGCFNGLNRERSHLCWTESPGPEKSETVAIPRHPHNMSNDTLDTSRPCSVRLTTPIHLWSAFVSTTTAWTRRPQRLEQQSVQHFRIRDASRPTGLWLDGQRGFGTNINVSCFICETKLKATVGTEGLCFFCKFHFGWCQLIPLGTTGFKDLCVDFVNSLRLLLVGSALLFLRGKSKLVKKSCKVGKAWSERRG